MNILKRMLPMPVRNRLRMIRKAVRYRYRRHQIARAVTREDPIKLILGAAETWQEGWYSTNEQWLDIARADHWAAVFGGRRIISHAVAEHVFEHLTEDQTRAALALIAAHMVPGGRLRIAVPDGHYPDPDYIRRVGINGIGDDAADHKQLLTVDSLSAMMRGAGFATTHVEGFEADGRLVTNRWDPADGWIRRSRQNPADTAWEHEGDSTSLIVDGVMP